MVEDNLGLIVVENAKEFGERVQKNLNKIRKDAYWKHYIKIIIYILFQM